jgi:hypothetical protein
MPLCTVMTQAGVLSAEAKTKLAGGLTSFHSEYAVIDHPDHAARQLVDALGQNLRELLTQKTHSSRAPKGGHGSGFTAVRRRIKQDRARRSLEV